MIRLIAALDVRRGIAVDDGIPWRLPGDVASFRSRTRTGVIVMGRSTYDEFGSPLHDRVNFVLTRSSGPLRAGFVPVADLDDLFAEHEREVVWVVGGAAVYSLALDRAAELALTQVDGDFACTKFFPAYEDAFTLAERGDEQREGGVAYRFETWRPRRVRR